MPTKIATKFTDNGKMEQVIMADLQKSDAQINANLTDSTGNPKPIGTKTEVSDIITDAGLGAGYELDENMVVQEIKRPINLRCIL